MSECYVHEKLRRMGSPCPYCTITSLKEEVEQLKSRLDVRYNDTDPPTFFDDAISRLETDNKRLREEVARISESDKAIFNALNGNVCDPNPVKPIWPNPACFTPTTYGLAVGLLRERDALRTLLAATEGKVEKQYELIDFYDAKVAAVMKWRESAYIPDDSDENELKRILLGE